MPVEHLGHSQRSIYRRGSERPTNTGLCSRGRRNREDLVLHSRHHDEREEKDKREAIGRSLAGFGRRLGKHGSQTFMYNSLDKSSTVF